MSVDMSKVHEPEHYVKGRSFQPWDVIRDWGLNFNLGSVVKYVARAGRKENALEDLYKAKEYLNKEIECMEADNKRKRLEIKKKICINGVIQYILGWEKDDDYVKPVSYRVRVNDRLVFEVFVPVNVPEIVILEAIKEVMKELGVSEV